MIKTELQIAENERDDLSILLRHVHSHEKNGRDEVHSHNFSQHQNDDIRRFATRYGVEEFRQSDEKSSNRRQNDDADEKKRYVLRPKFDVKFKSHVSDGDLDSARDRIRFADAIENDINRANEDFINAIEREEVPDEIEIFTLERSRVDHAIAHCMQVDELQKQLTTQFLVGIDVVLKKRRVRVFGRCDCAAQDAPNAPNSTRRRPVTARLIRVPNRRQTLFLTQNHLERLIHTSFHVVNVGVGYVTHEVGHVRVGAVDGTEAGQDGHDGDADHADTTNQLLNRKDAVLGTE